MFARCKEKEIGKIIYNGKLQIEDPDGHRFYISEGSTRRDPIYKVTLNTSDMEKTTREEFFFCSILKKYYLGSVFFSSFV